MKNKKSHSLSKSQEEVKRIKFLDISIDIITKNKCFSEVEKFLQSEDYHYQISINIAKIVDAQKNLKLKNIINNSDIINSDGKPVEISARIISGSKVDRMGGLDYIEGLARNFKDNKYYFLGAEDHIIKKVVEHYKNNYSMNIVGYRNGYFSSSELPDIINDINNSGAEILFIGMGTPDKEYLLDYFREKLNVKFAVGVGGAFDIIAGKTKRAPIFLQKISLEWAYRVYQEPGRLWKRYARTNIAFIWLLFKSLFYYKNKGE